MLSINTSSSIGKIAFRLVKNVNSEDFFVGNCKVASNRLVSKYAPHAALSLLKLRSKFHNSKLELIDKDLDEWISNLEMNEFSLKGNITDKDFMIYILNNLTEDFNAILDGLEVASQELGTLH